MFDRQKRADQIDLQNIAANDLDRLLEQRNETAADPGIGIDDVERAELLQRAVDESLDLSSWPTSAANSSALPPLCVMAARSRSDPSAF